MTASPIEAKHLITISNTGRLVGIALVAGTLGCAGLMKADKIRQFSNPQVDASKIARIAIIADGPSKGDLQVMARAREHLVKAGIPIIKKSGEWDSDQAALQDICVQKPGSSDNVDGVLIVGWERITLHECLNGSIALDVVGKYAGTDELTRRVVSYLHASTTPTTTSQ